MPALQVKEFPPDLYDELRACATAEDRSISQQTVHILRTYLRAYRELGGRVEWTVTPSDPAARETSRKLTPEEERQARAERRRKVFERIESRPYIPIPDDFPSPAEIVRQMREERDAQLVPELAGF